MVERHLEQEKTERLTLKNLWKIFRRRWWILLIAFVVVSLVTGIVAYATHKDEYTATAKLWAYRNVSSSGNDEYADLITSFYSGQEGAQLINDFQEIIVTDEVMNRVLETYEAYPRDVEHYGEPLKLNKTKLKSMVKITANDSKVFSLAVTLEERPYDAELLANIWSEEFCNYISELMDGQELVQPVDLPTIRAEATDANPDGVHGAARITNPVSKLKIILIGVLAAFLVYVGFLIHFLTDDKIKTPDDVKNVLGLNLLGAIPSQQNMSNVKWKVYGSEEGDEVIEFEK